MRRNNLARMIAILVLMPPLMSAAAAQEAKPLRILFVGNSYTSFNNLPGMLQQLAAAKKRRIDYETSLRGGWTLLRHATQDEPPTKEMIAKGGFGFVVLQDQSQMPYRYPKATLEHGGDLGKLAKEHGATPLLFMTWARLKEPENQAPLAATYRKLGEELNAPVAPVGLAWEAALKQRKDLRLHANDGSHPTPKGTYLAACVFYAVIFDESPHGLPAVVTQGDGDDRRTLVRLNADEARTLQKIAWDVVQSHREAKTQAPERP